VPIEPRLSLQWFLKYPRQKEARDVVLDAQMRFSGSLGQGLRHWMSNLQDGASASALVGTPHPGLVPKRFG